MLTIISKWKWSSTLKVTISAGPARARARVQHVDDVSLHRYIHKYSDFLVALISVGIAQARPNNYIILFSFNMALLIISVLLYENTKYVMYNSTKCYY